MLYAVLCHERGANVRGANVRDSLGQGLMEVSSIFTAALAGAMDFESDIV